MTSTDPAELEHWLEQAMHTAVPSDLAFPDARTIEGAWRRRRARRRMAAGGTVLALAVTGTAVTAVVTQPDDPAPVVAPAKVEAPVLLGLDLATAREHLRDSGVTTPPAITILLGDESSDLVVLEQDPAPGVVVGSAGVALRVADLEVGPLPTRMIVANGTDGEIWVQFVNGSRARVDPGRTLRLSSDESCSLLPLVASAADGTALGSYDQPCAGQTWVVGRDD